MQFFRLMISNSLINSNAAMFLIIATIIVLFSISNTFSLQYQYIDSELPKLRIINNQNEILNIVRDVAYNFSYIVVNPENTVHIVCVGSREIDWMFQDYHPKYHTYDVLPSNIKVTNNLCNASECRTELIIDGIEVVNVGEFSCHYSDQLDNPLFGEQNSIYIYVKDHYLIAGHEDMIPVTQYAFRNHSLNIDCRPANPLVSVTLRKVYGIYHKKYRVIEIDNTSVFYNPKTGFFIDSITDDNSNGYECVGSFANEVQTIEISIRFIERNYRKPIIDAEGADVVFLNSNFTLNCILESRNRKDFERKLVHLIWKTHNLKSSRLRLNDAVFVDKFHRYHTLNVEKRLTVFNAKKTDEGMYECIASQTPTINNTFSTYFVKVYDYELNEKNIRLKLSFINKFYRNHDNTHNSYNNSYECIVGSNIRIEIKIISEPNDTKLYNKYLELELKSRSIIDTQTNSKPISMERVDSIVCVTIMCDTLNDTQYYQLIANFFNITQTNIAFHAIPRNRTQHSHDYINKTEFNKMKNTNTNYESSAMNLVLVAVFVLVGSVLLVISVILGKKIRVERLQKRELELLSKNLFESGQMEMLNPDLPLDEQIELLPYDHRWEFPRDKLILGQILGQGAFGRVVMADMIGLEPDSSTPFSRTTVAVKMLKERADMNQRKALLAELKILIHVGHHMNIVNLLGAVTKDIIRGDLLVVVEYCRYGSLRAFLLNHRNAFVDQIDKDSGLFDLTINDIVAHKKSNNTKQANKYISTDYQNLDLIKEVPSSGRVITSSDLVSYAFQCAKGMEYLASKRLIHRDLAARNVLLADDDVVKICDFGLARNTCNYGNYVKKGDTVPLPIKWMSIESIRDKVFNTKSDVWSYGVLLWEIFTLGANPYPGFEIDEQFYKRLTEGYRMDRPEFSNDEIYDIMQDCWLQEPQYRPDFTTIANKFGNILEESAKQRYAHQLKLYELSIKDSHIRAISEYIPMRDSDKVDHYIDMSSSNGSAAKVTIVTSDKIIYDTVKDVRSIYHNFAVSNTLPAMETVPMIQF